MRYKANEVSNQPPISTLLLGSRWEIAFIMARKPALISQALARTMFSAGKDAGYSVVRIVVHDHDKRYEIIAENDSQSRKTDQLDAWREANGSSKVRRNQ